MKQLQVVIFGNFISVYYKSLYFHDDILTLLDNHNMILPEVKLVDKPSYNLIDVHCKNTDVLYDCLFVLSTEFTLIVS